MTENPRVVALVRLFVGTGMVLGAAYSALNPIQLAPSDPRNQPWFQVVMLSLLAAIGSLGVVAGLVGLWLSRRGD